MIIPELKSIMSPDLPAGELPAEPEDCNILIEVTIRPKGQSGEDIFSFSVVTPKHLAHESRTRWGRGLLMVNEFEWKTVEHSLQKLLMHAYRDTWNETATVLNREMYWEFENYQE